MCQLLKNKFYIGYFTNNLHVFPPFSCTLRRLPLVVCVPLRRQSLCATSCWEAWLCVGEHGMLGLVYGS